MIRLIRTASRRRRIRRRNKENAHPDEIDALIDRETAADLTIDIDALDRLYEETPTPPDPSQI